MFTRFSLTILFIATGIFSFGQTTTVTGKVTDNKSRPLAGVSITLKNTYDGATTDSSGKFRFRTTEKGDQLIEISTVGYKPFQQAVKLDGTAINIETSLKEEQNELQAVTITAGTFEASDRKKAGVVLSPIDVVTTASANGDLTGALKTLPGAQQVGESEGLFVRGGTAAETKHRMEGFLHLYLKELFLVPEAIRHCMARHYHLH